MQTNILDNRVGGEGVQGVVAINAGHIGDSNEMR